MLPRIDDVLQEIASRTPTIYSSLDLFKGFWAIPLENTRIFTVLSQAFRIDIVPCLWG